MQFISVIINQSIKDINQLERRNLLFFVSVFEEKKANHLQQRSILNHLFGKRDGANNSIQWLI